MLISAGEIISKSITLYRTHWKSFAEYLLYIGAPLVLSTGLSALVDPNDAGLLGLFFVVTIALYLFLMLVSISFIRAIADAYTGEKIMPVKEALKASTKFFWPAVFVMILTGLIILGGFILVVVPGIIFMVWYAFGYYEVVLDGEQGWKALQTSRQLVLGRWWATLWRLLAPGFVFAVLLFVGEGLFTLFGNVIAKSVPSLEDAVVLIVGLFILLLSLALSPLSSAAPTILYLELKKTPHAKTASPNE